MRNFKFNEWYRQRGKRLFDLVIAIDLLMILWPLILTLSVAIFLKMGYPILFKQMRPGLKGQVFIIYKFRTMTNDRDDSGQLLPDEKRLTKFGMFLRSTSLDELLEILNILKGEMSFIGPRPLLVRYLDRYTPEQARRHEIKPGITGWAQVNGRNAITWEEKFKLDVYYVDHHSFWLDVKILSLTLIKVISREGISGENQATMSEFMGY